ncbi:hypothetical protein D1115_08530 [Vibrio alfacsensis]|uniref:Uncharacterized protein n=1 Tax=Vibrio alfacsensis TaxID=1074311 RepID=A0ABM6YU86_9VIBR|nr:hypothetical protein [Vibrio alfacsensis]AXY01227.1 hypothetical protein D1115_08530 [Vibrio alfacsensis]
MNQHKNPQDLNFSNPIDMGSSGFYKLASDIGQLQFQLKLTEDHLTTTKEKSELEHQYNQIVDQLESLILQNNSLLQQISCVKSENDEFERENSRLKKDLEQSAAVEEDNRSLKESLSRAITIEQENGLLKKTLEQKIAKEEELEIDFENAKKALKQNHREYIANILESQNTTKFYLILALAASVVINFSLYYS